MRIFFKTPPTFVAGVNATFRLGTQWAQRVEEEDIIEAWETHGARLFDIMIVKVHVHNLGDIPQDLLDHAYNSEFATHDGLLEGLRETYGRDKINIRTKLTILLFEKVDRLYCALCGSDNTKVIEFCTGCGQYVCEQCDRAKVESDHEVGQHLGRKM